MDERQIGDKLGVNWKETRYGEFCMGMKVEQEHKDITKGDPMMTAKIVLAHLTELPDYYTRLERMETNGKHDKYDKKSDQSSIVLRRKANA
jgi:hypothetical protein